MARDSRIRVVLVSLIVLDLGLSAWGLGFPDAWYRFFHAAPRVDPQGLLARAAASWVMFFVVQSTALARWRREPGWLVAVAGMRLGDALTDVTCLAACESATIFAWIGFPLAGAGNLALGAWLWRQYRERSSEARSTASA